MNRAAGVLEQILDLGRWAPSGDNTQPWRFEIAGERHVVVHGHDTRDHCVYDLDGHPSQISLGALIETIAIAATAHGLATQVERRAGLPETTPTFDLHFEPAGMAADPLVAAIPKRSVQRRPMRRRALTATEKAALAASVGKDYEILWLEGRERWRTAKLMYANAKLRLTMPEAYEVHRDIIEWNARYSAGGVPDQALGVDPMTAKLMRVLMQDWRRIAFFNRYLAGTVAPRIQMDLLPGIACAAHYVLQARRPPVGIDDYVAAGRALQRFWLTATQLELAMQPELTPLIFGRYVREGRRFSTTPGMQEAAQRLAGRLAELIGAEPAARAVFMGRVGAGPQAEARSLRRPLAELMLAPAHRTD
ncbi:MAG: nitroreductase family protein [Proteobacteria bacterium]|nr:nitroreductase family protein [Pseudomonadota bacterium]